MTIVIRGQCRAGPPGRALEVGVGTGRFAGPLGIRFGLDPALAMLWRARGRGVRVVRGVGERLPFRPRSFDRVLIALTLCYFDAPDEALLEARRVLRPEGRLVLGFLDPASPPGRRYRTRRRGRFYEEAEFRASDEVERMLDAAGFRPARWVQTLFRLPDELEAPEPPRSGSGSGIFVVVEARVGDGGEPRQSDGSGARGRVPANTSTRPRSTSMRNGTLHVVDPRRGRIHTWCRRSSAPAGE